ncbi:MAG: phosphodiester glycosidase family protein [Acidobacteriota bacterium]|nr:phosphodiester glycosidase family protein [Acidobacteriota bacterium]
MHRKIFPIALILALSCAEPSQAAPLPPEPTTEMVAPGLKHFVYEKGEAATETSFRIVVGVFESQSEADRVLGRLQASGFSALVDADGTNYRVFVPGFSRQTLAEETRQHLLGQGYPLPLGIQETVQDLTHPSGPWRIHVLEADPKKIDVHVAHAYDAAIGLETTTELAQRRGALAAINGGYFQMEGLLAGDSLGALRIDGTLLSEPDRERASVGFFDRDGVAKAVFGRLGFRGQARLASEEVILLNGVNRRRKASEIVLYTPEFHRTTLTSSQGAEIIIENDRIAEIRNDAGSSVIPATGMVLSIGSERVEEVLPQLHPGERLTVETDVLPLLPDPEGQWKQTEYIVSGGPLLLWKGQGLEEPEKESISRVFFLARHPRTAAGVRADGTLLFVTVDGRQPETSVGMSIPELTDLMLELGCVSAINLDGGGSTTMVIEGQVVNRPSSSGGDRRNADAILLFPRRP